MSGCRWGRVRRLSCSPAGPADTGQTEYRQRTREGADRRRKRFRSADLAPVPVGEAPVVRSRGNLDSGDKSGWQSYPGRVYSIPSRGIYSCDWDGGEGRAGLDCQRGRSGGAWAALLQGGGRGDSGCRRIRCVGVLYRVCTPCRTIGACGGSERDLGDGDGPPTRINAVLHGGRRRLAGWWAVCASRSSVHTHRSARGDRSEEGRVRRPALAHTGDCPVCARLRRRPRERRTAAATVKPGETRDCPETCRVRFPFLSVAGHKLAVP